MICSTHVDDLKLGGRDDWTAWLLERLEHYFGKLKIQYGTFEHCGIIHTLKPDGSYELSQDHFVARLKTADTTGIDRSKLTTLLNEAQITMFQSGVGSLAWVVQTRMDCAIYIQALQRAAKAPTVAHLLRLNAVIKWCKRKPCFLKYVKLLTPFFKVLCCNDAAFRREDATGLAMRGSIIGLAEDHVEQPGGLVNTLDFFARRQRRVVRSTFGAETNSLADGVEIGKMVAYTLAEILLPGATAKTLVQLDEEGNLPIKLQAITDCRSLFDALKAEETQIPTEQSLILLLLQLKESLRTTTLKSIVWCDTRDMVADGLNKGVIARRDLLNFSMTAQYTFRYEFQMFSETVKTTIVSSRNDALGNVSLFELRSSTAKYMLSVADSIQLCGESDWRMLRPVED
jgi:hypothetical protein